MVSQQGVPGVKVSGHAGLACRTSGVAGREPRGIAGLQDGAVSISPVIAASRLAAASYRYHLQHNSRGAVPVSVVV
ncbi:hypothetical protein CBM2606_A70045 [Cupriavidus taiwanensis]|nr:hypothetical protein CBM2606_A70045 [Cupriavidus taiwanensis]